MRVHVVYPIDPQSVCAPWTIGNALVSYFLGKGCSVTWADWDSLTCPSDRVDLLVGHPHGEPGRAFELAAGVNPWARRIAICPWNGRPDWQERLDDLLRAGVYRHLLAICGPYWAERLPAHWPATPLAAAADENVWPWRDPSVVQLGASALYVGCVAPGKGTDYLAEISEHTSIGMYHVGYGTIGGLVRELGHMPNGSWRDVAYDTKCIVSVGDHDANPFALLEGALMGLTPLCTPTCGWGADLAIQLPVGNAKAAADAIEHYAYYPEDRRAAARAYSWRRFFETLDSAIRMVCM